MPPARLRSSSRAAGTADVTPELPGGKVEAVQAAVLAWYRKGHRNLPWRFTRDPYAILVSEVMLQQTQVDRVLPKYLAWLERYPTLATLAAAPRGEVIRAWAPLGYNLRAVRLHEIAQQAVAQLGGRLPETVEGLLSLKGIGRYTAGAVACFALGQVEPVMDTNIRRVLGRIFAADVPGALEDDRLAWGLAEAALPRGGGPTDAAREAAAGRVAGGGAGPGQAEDAYDWNQALMDLGATVCLARNPRCPVCPAQAWCSARAMWFAPEAVQLGLGSFGDMGDREPDGALPLVAETRAPYAAGAPGRAERTQGRSKRKGGEGERFEGSRRWFRGRVVDALRALPAGGSLSLVELGAQVKPEFAVDQTPWLRELVEALAKDGLVEVVEGADGETRVSLPG